MFPSLVDIGESLGSSSQSSLHTFKTHHPQGSSRASTCEVKKTSSRPPLPPGGDKRTVPPDNGTKYGNPPKHTQNAHLIDANQVGVSVGVPYIQLFTILPMWFSWQMPTPTGPPKSGKLRPISRTVLGKNAVLTRSKSADKHFNEQDLCVTSARIVSLLGHLCRYNHHPFQFLCRSPRKDHFKQCRNRTERSQEEHQLNLPHIHRLMALFHSPS